MNCHSMPKTTCTALAAPAAAGNDGHAISLVSRDEENLLAGIEQLIKRPLPMIWLTGF